MAKDPSRTEKATPKRLQKAREKGNVAKSQEVTKTVTLIAGFVGVTFWLGYIARQMMALFRHFLSQGASFEVNDANISALGLWLATEIAKMLLPVMLCIGLAVFISLRAQVGKLWTTKVFEFSLEKFNPVNGLRRMFLSLQTFIRLGKSLLQALCIGVAPWLILKKEIPNMLSLYDLDAAGVAAYILTTGSRVVIYALAPMAVIAAVDWWYTRWEYAENLKMTKDEVKDERKQQEGDPQVKSKIRQKMAKMSSRRMMAEVPRADVIITSRMVTTPLASMRSPCRAKRS